MEQEDPMQIRKVQCDKEDHSLADILAVGVKENNFLQLLCFYCQASPLNSIMYPTKFLEQIKKLEYEAISKDNAEMEEQKVVKEDSKGNIESKFQILKQEIKIAICNLKKLYEECNKFMFQYQQNQNSVVIKYQDIISDFKQRIQNSTNIQEQQQTLIALSQYLTVENNSLQFKKEDLNAIKNNDGYYYDKVYKNIQIQISKINSEITQSMSILKDQLNQVQSQQVQIDRVSQIKMAYDYKPEVILKTQAERINLLQNRRPGPANLVFTKFTNNQVFIQCQICTLEDIPQEEALKIKGCTHEFCKECLKYHLNLEIQNKKQNIQDINDLKCPGMHRNGQSCPMPISVEHLQVLWTKEEFETFQRQIQIQCQNIKCRKNFQCQKSENLTCPHCELAHCYQCRGLKQQDHKCAQKIEKLFETLFSLQSIESDEQQKQMQQQNDEQAQKKIIVRFCPNQDCIKNGPIYYMQKQYNKYNDEDLKFKCTICLEEFNFCCSSTMQPSRVHDLSFHRSECPIYKYVADLNKFDYVKEYPEKDKYQPNDCSECKKAGKFCSRPISYTEFLNKILVEEKFSKADILQIDPKFEEELRKGSEYNQQNEQLAQKL